MKAKEYIKQKSTTIYNGGVNADKDFVERIQVYTKELKEYTDKHSGEWSEWLNNLISNRYGFKPYKL